MPSAYLVRILRVLCAVSLLLAVEIVATGLLCWAAPAPLTALRAPGSAGLEAALVLVCAALAWVCLTWLILGLLLTALATVPGLATGAVAALAERVTPPLVRRVAVALLGVTVVGAPGVLAGSAAASGPAPSAVPAVLTVPAAPAPLPELDRPAAPPTPPADPAGGSASPLPRAAPATASATVVVRPGDTLWELAARALGPAASATDVRAAWPRWHLRNRQVIGSDPDLIHPGQTLRLPDKETS